MSQLILYNGLRATIEAMNVYKYVRLYNSQFEHQQANANDQNAFLFPCCLIQLKPATADDLLLNNQKYGMTVTLHIGFESYKDEDADFLQLKQDTYKAVQGKQYGYFTKLLRRDERPNYDHPNALIYEQDYYCEGKDFDADERPATLTGSPIDLNATPQVIQPQ